jgi:magnesium transporter
MISRYTYHGLTWLDLENPSREEILHILEEFSLPHLLSDEMYTTTLRSKVDLYSDLVYLILHFPVSSHGTVSAADQEVDFIIGKQFIITVHYETVSPLQEFAKTFETKALHDTTDIHAGLIFMEMIKAFYHRSLHELEEQTKNIRDIENRIFAGEEEAMVRRISHTQRKLLDFKQAIRFHGDILRSYESASERFFGTEYRYFASIISAEYNKVSSVLESNRDLLTELQRTNDSLLSTKSNDIMKTFTVMTFVMIPLTLITSIFGMNTSDNLVFIRSTSDFFFVIGVMLIIAFIMFLFFRFRKWL